MGQPFQTGTAKAGGALHFERQFFQGVAFKIDLLAPAQSFVTAVCGKLALIGHTTEGVIKSG